MPGLDCICSVHMTVLEQALLFGHTQFLESEGVSSLRPVWMSSIVLSSPGLTQNWSNHSILSECDQFQQKSHIDRLAAVEVRCSNMREAARVTLRHFVHQALDRSGLGLMQASAWGRNYGNLQKLILSFAAQRPRLSDFEGACEGIEKSWWLDSEPVHHPVLSEPQLGALSLSQTELNQETPA